MRIPNVGVRVRVGVGSVEFQLMQVKIDDFIACSATACLPNLNRFSAVPTPTFTGHSFTLKVKITPEYRK